MCAPYRCRPGFFNLQQENPAGCQPCFCFGHSLACSSSNHHAAVNITSDFLEGIVLGSPTINEVPLLLWGCYYPAKINNTNNAYFVLSEFAPTSFSLTTRYLLVSVYCGVLCALLFLCKYQLYWICCFILFSVFLTCGQERG